MLSILYVSIIMQFFYINWQQHWECDRTMNIGANAHGKRTVSTKQPQVTDLTSVSPLTVGFPVTSEWYWTSFQVTRLFHSATIFSLLHICCLKLHRADFQVEEVFFFFLTSIWCGSTQLQCIYYLRRILISRPPRVFRRFKRRSCSLSANHKTLLTTQLKQKHMFSGVRVTPQESKNTLTEHDQYNRCW